MTKKLCFLARTQPSTLEFGYIGSEGVSKSFEAGQPKNAKGDSLENFNNQN